MNNLLISGSFLMVSGGVWRMYRKMEINLNKSTGTGQQGSVENQCPEKGSQYRTTTVTMMMMMMIMEVIIIFDIGYGEWWWSIILWGSITSEQGKEWGLH